MNEENELGTKSSKFSEANRLNRRSYLNGRKRFLARSAIALMEQLPKKMITDFEYNSVADVFRDIGEYEQANIYYKKGINRATVPYYKSIIERTYADYLFSQGDFKKGRQYYNESLSLVGKLVKGRPIEQKADPYIFHIAETHERWADTEASYSFSVEAVKLFYKAIPIYQRLSDSSRELRHEALDRIRRKRAIIIDHMPEEQTRLIMRYI